MTTDFDRDALQAEIDDEGGILPDEVKLGHAIWGNIEERQQDLAAYFDRMDQDFPLYKLDNWIPDEEEPISPEDAYTTNAPRVLAQKIISFITSTELVVRIPNDFADDQQESINDFAETLAIGMLNNADKRLRRANKQSVKDQLGWFTVVRGGYAAVRAMLRKGPDGQTFADILPLDPRHLVIDVGDEEPNWAAHMMVMTRKQIQNRYPGFKFPSYRQDMSEDSNGEPVWEYIRRIPNEFFDPASPNPFIAHPARYEVGTLIDGRWARTLHPVFTLMFPIIAIPVGEQPFLTPTHSENDIFTEAGSFGESIFADSRKQWDFFNRWMSYNMKLTAEAADPSKKVYSMDGTKALDDGASEKGSEINLSTANQEEVVYQETPDVKNASALTGQQLNIDIVAGGLPPQSYGLLDKPLSGVALSQLGQNLEQKVVPRMKAVAQCIESAVELMIGQYETGGFEPFTVSGTRSSLVRFANQRVAPEQILGHDPVEVTMDLALPEDQTTRWTVAQMALQPIAPDGAPLMSKEWVLEKILKVQSPKTIFRQNLERVAHTSFPVAQIWEMLQMALQEGNQLLASALFDQLRIAVLQQQVQGSVQLQQLGLIAQGIALDPRIVNQQIAGQIQAQGGLAGNNGGAGNNQALNPANGAIPFAQAAGVGNQPSPEAGFNTTAPRQRDTGLISATGEPILAN